MNTYTYVNKDPSSTQRESLSDLMKAPILAFDTEGNGLNMGRHIPLGCSIATNPYSAFYVDRDYIPGLLPLMDESKTFAAHNAKHDRAQAKKMGITMNKIFDTLIACHLLEIAPADLKSATQQCLGYNIIEFGDLPTHIDGMSFQAAGEYSGPHSYSTFGLYEYTKKEMNKKGLLNVFENIESPIIPVISDMELNGMPIDRKQLGEVGDYCDKRMELLHGVLDDMVGSSNVNYNSPDQLSKLLYGSFQVPKPPEHFRTDSQKLKGTWSTGKEHLEQFKDKIPFLRMYLEWRHLGKIKSTYVNGILERMIGNKIFASFNQDGTGTGRLSSSDPNLQNIPAQKSDLIGRLIRRAFICEEGEFLLKFDCAQLELRAIAIIAQEKFMMAAFNAGRDIHAETAIRVFGDIKYRPEAKTLNFQIVYGGGEERLRELFFAAYPGIDKWTKQQYELAHETGGAKTMFGRFRTIPALESGMSWMVEHGERQAVSTIVQGSSAEIVKIMMRRAWDGIQGTPIKMLLQVHDELVFRGPIAWKEWLIDMVKTKIPYYELPVPILVEMSVGTNWDKMEGVK